MKRIRRCFDILRKPYRTMKGMAPDWWDVAIVFSLIILLNIIQDWLKVTWADEPIRWINLLGEAVLGLMIPWLLLTVLLYVISFYLKGFGNFWKFLQYMGYATLPFLLTSSASVLVMIILRALGAEQGLDIWIVINRVLLLFGMLWGWPGCLSYSAVRVVLLLPKNKTIYVIIGVWLTLIIGWALPVIVPILFGLNT